MSPQVIAFETDGNPVWIAAKPGVRGCRTSSGPVTAEQAKEQRERIAVQYEMQGQEPLAYRVASFHAAGLEAKWGRNHAGRPVLFARKPGGKTWWLVTAGCWARAKVVGIAEAFDEATLLGDTFSLPV